MNTPHISTHSTVDGFGRLPVLPFTWSAVHDLTRGSGFEATDFSLDACVSLIFEQHSFLWDKSLSSRAFAMML